MVSPKARKRTQNQSIWKACEKDKKKDLENLTLAWPKDSYTHHNMNHNAYRQSGKIHPNGLAG